MYGPELLAEADTSVLPGVADPPETLPPGVAEALREAAANGTRIASVCVGAFLFAATGLLDGLRATTHWFAAPDLAARHPKVTVDPEALYVDNGQFLTSAGASAALDMCLRMIREDYGSAVAAHTARMSVMPLEREGGQAQFIVRDPPPTPAGRTLEPLLCWMEEHCERDLALGEIAAHAGMSHPYPQPPFPRADRHDAGAAAPAGEGAAGPASAGDDVVLRGPDRGPDRVRLTHRLPGRFRRVVGTSPQGYRRAFRSRQREG